MSNISLKNNNIELNAILETVNSLSSGKEEQEKSVEITENGTTEIAPDEGKTLSKVTITANIEGGGGDIAEERSKWAERSWTEFSDNELTRLGKYAFGYCTSLTSIDLPMCSYVGQYAFAYCYSLSSVNLPMGSNIQAYAFANCSSLSSIDLPVCKTTGLYAFNNCTSLTSLTLGYSSIANLANINVFNNTPMSNSTYTGSFGSIYVPASLVDAYKSATNWVTYADRITAIVE